MRTAIFSDVHSNLDAAVAGVQDVEYFNGHARRAVEWTRQTLCAERLGPLLGFRLTHSEAEAFFVHSEPGDPRTWGYVCDAADAASALTAVAERLLYVGHSHLAFVCAAARDVRTVVETDSIELVRVAYDVTAAGQKILDAGLPRFLAERLAQGC